MRKMYLVYVALFAAQFILAVICAPHSCDWGNTVYFYFGLFSLIASLLLPLFQKNIPMPKGIGLGFLFLVISVIFWLAGFMLCGFRIVCKLF